MKKILITGATGFIGKHLYKYFESNGFEVTGISLSGGLVENKRIHRLNITNSAAVDNFFKINHFDAIFHLAAFVPPIGELYESIIQMNCLGTLNLLRSSVKHNVGKFIYSSSASVYNHAIVSRAKESDANPSDIYGLSKLLSEKFCEKFVKKDLTIIILRYSSVFGPGQKDNSVLPIFLSNASVGADLLINGNGRRSQDFIYYKDVIRANVLAYNSKVSNVYNIGSGVETSLKDLAETIIKITNSSSKIVYNLKIKDNDVRFFLDISKAKKFLGYSPDFNLQKGLKEYIFALDEIKKNK